MNIFGAFTFGSLIKTFLPGFVWLIALGILEADFAQWRGQEPVIWSFLKTKDQAALVLAIPASILLGLLSNVVVFMGLNDRWVRNPFLKEQPGLSRLYERLSAQIREQCWTGLAWNDAGARPDFDKHIDPEIIIIERIGAEKLAYVREQYWYHLEFQLNLLLSLLATFAALLLSALINARGWRMLGLVILWLVAGYLVRKWLLQAARKNYARHIAKMASLMTAHLTPPPAPGP
jgi:hypothetical protein